MSTEPPSRILPKGVSHETKSAAEDLASTRKVEKVRKIDEVDADEKTRKQRFRKMMGDEETTPLESEHPSPFEIMTRGSDQPTEEENPSTTTSVFGSAAQPQVATPSSSYGDIDDAIIASPAYTTPPDLTSTPPPEEDEEDENATTGALPQSDDFWENSDLPPDRPLQAQSFQETPKSAARFAKEVPPGTEEKGAGKKGAGIPIKTEAKKTEPSPFGPPGKPFESKMATSPKLVKGAPAPQKPVEKKPLPSPFEVSVPRGKEAEKASMAGRYFAPEELAEKGRKPRTKEKQEEAGAFAVREPISPFRSEGGEEERGGGKRGREQKIVEIEAPSSTLLPSNVQPGAFAAASVATPYLHPTTVSLFFQMVGTIYVMSVPPGIERTEIVLDNPAYAHSRFFGSTITIEKYATAPDSFNIRLTGNPAAVVSFKENIPSLMAAFQNSNLPFRIHRIEAEYSIERPLFRRKERGEGRGEAGGGDLGERRK